MTDFTERRRVMVDTQVRPSDVTKFPIIDAMLSVPREAFVPEARKAAAYAGENIELGGGRTILEPRTLAKLLDAVDVGPGEMALDIGPAYGYSTALLARLAEAVVAVEEDADMAREAETALSDHGFDNALVVTGPLTEGAPQHGPYDVIVLQGAVEALPMALEAQLAEGGRIGALFAEGRLGVARLGLKVDGRVSWRDLFNAGAPVLPGFARDPVFEF
ncbi:protein-L-isoaspartate O-methyltransferase [Rhodobacteraceae bacterium CCMM004]|nr:protein-L-isoaspartate O-methyltransferase [Rhodobacteraceae bacterium CCMM004]